MFGQGSDVGLIDRIFGRKSDARTLYDAIVARARQPHWYQDGGVADTIDGRFDMIAVLMSLVLLRLETDPAADALGVALAERFVDDIDPQLREIGIGDIVVGKHMGRMMGMLGGRLGAYRAGLAEGSFEAALIRNLYRDVAPAQAALAHSRDSLMRFNDAVLATPVETLAKGGLPQ